MKVCIGADIEGVAGIAYDIPGMTVSIVKDDKLIFPNGYVKPKIKLETGKNQNICRYI